MDARIALSTCPNADSAERIARTLVEERLAACVSRVGGVTSTYRWNGAVASENEVLLLIKTTADRYAAMETRLVELHPYEVPEVLAITPDGGSAPYLAWLTRETRGA